MGIEISRPKNVHSSLAEEVGEGEIRVVDSLSINAPDILLGNVFSPDSHLESVNWDSVDDPDFLERWEKARKIINANDKGSFGANFFEHSEAIKAIFPELQDAEDIYNQQFKNLIRLARFGLKKANESGHSKNVRILAFGHENYMGWALDKYFQDNEITNCETVHIEVDEDERVHMTRRGQEQIISE